MGRNTYIQTEANTSNLVELLLQEITDLKALVCKLQPHDYSQLLTEREAADRLSISYRTLITLRYENKIAYRMIGNCVRYSLGDILEFEERCRRPVQN
jgi:hypothetical protein